MGPYIFTDRRRFFSAAVMFAVVYLCAGRVAMAEDRIDFRLMREVSVKLVNGSSVRGKLKSISPTEVVVLMKDDVEKAIPIDTVRIVSPNDKSFSYSPAGEGFDELAGRASKLQGATVYRDPANAGVAATAEEKSAGSGSNAGGPGGPPAVFARMSGFGSPLSDSKLASSGGFVTVDGFAGASFGPQEKVKLDTSAVATLMHNAATSSAAGEAATRPTPPKGPLIGKPGETVMCSNPQCRKVVTNARYGDKCPHCGVSWVQETAADVIASGKVVEGQPVAGNPFGSGASKNTAQAAAVAQSSPTVAAPQSFNLEAVPWWGKAAGFAGLLAVLWFVSQRR